MSVSAPSRSSASPMNDPERAKQVAQAEELLFSGPQKSGFAKALFQGEYRGHVVHPYPTLTGEAKVVADAAVAEVRAFAEANIDAAAIDRDADIPASVIQGLGRVGVLGMTAPREFGGRGFTQSQYCKIMEVIGGHCSSTAVFVNAHHSIGIRALLLFGTREQQERWLPPLATGEKLAAFALTETDAGSDASNVQTTATPSADGSTYILNGTKRYITNGGIADVLTVMAKTPDPRGGDPKVSAFLVTPDLPGFEVVTARMPKCGIRGTATAKLAFHDMPVPATNLLGPLGKGLRVALTVLDFGRTTFGASCTGAAKTCLSASVRHANRRRQFGRPLADLELVKKKIARMAAFAYAMEATTAETAALIDSGAEDYMLETAILKVFSTEALWECVYETLQIHGGQGYFSDEPYERMMRDARINQIGEGANEVLKSFIAMVGMRDIGMGLAGTLAGMKSPATFFPTLWGFGKTHAARFVGRPDVPIGSTVYQPAAKALARRVKRFGWAVEKTLIKYQEAILEAGYVHERIADAAIALLTSACTLARLDREDRDGTSTDLDRAAGDLYLKMAGHTFDLALHNLAHNDDRALTRTADFALRSGPLGLNGR
ncbi:MAG: acyl-CoA dehydrogenase [Planctomycetota bacterium]|nr:acyl-CoA dehydrogenase [Planctomycetota bacterium]